MGVILYFPREDRKKSKRRFFETRQRSGKKKKERKRSERVIVTDLATDGTDERDGNALLAFGKKEREEGIGREKKGRRGGRKKMLRKMSGGSRERWRIFSAHSFLRCSLSLYLAISRKLRALAADTPTFSFRHLFWRTIASRCIVLWL